MSATAATSSVAAAAKAVTRTNTGGMAREINGIVVSAGLASKTVKVRVPYLEWNKKVKKNFKRFEHHLVHDPNDSLRTGDVVSIVSGWRTSKSKRHVVNRIVAPWGPPLEERPPVPTPEQREAAHAAERAKKTERKSLRNHRLAMEKAVAKAEKSIQDLMSMGKELGYKAP